MRSKKAQMKWVIAVLLFLVVIIVVIALVYKIKLITEKGVGKSVCKLSVQKLAMGKEVPLIGKSLVGSKLECEREKLIFKKDESQDEKSQKLAKAIDNCVDNFWEGKKDFTNVDFMGSSTHCAICSKISFEKGATFDADKYKIWTQTHQVPRTSMTYEQYFKDLTEYDTNVHILTIYDIDASVLSNPSKEYYMYFYVDQGADLITKAVELLPGFDGTIGQTTKFRLDSTDNALRDCENLLN